MVNMNPGVFRPPYMDDVSDQDEEETTELKVDTSPSPSPMT